VLSAVVGSVCALDRLVAVLLIAGLQLTLFAMWFDMEANQGLR
jgi:hypothetical protein